MPIVYLIYPISSNLSIVTMKGRRRFFFTLIKDLVYKLLAESHQKSSESEKRHQYSTH